jgi:hypothetical protein
MMKLSTNIYDNRISVIVWNYVHMKVIIEDVSQKLMFDV